MPPDEIPHTARSCGILRDIQPLQRDGQKLIDQEIGVAVAERIVFERPIAAVLGAGLRGGNRAGIHEDGDRHRHRLLMNQIVEDDRHAKVAVLPWRSPIHP